VYHYHSCHTGQDIGASSGTPIHAADAGVVLSVGKSRAYGNVTLIDHGNGLVTMYAHQSRFGVSQGDVVGVGDVIGYVGSTGFSTGPHLHFEVHINGVPYNPMGWFGGSKYVVPCWGQ
jgi:murein DD-endopeptidase MepM/ murein hydrolase activator NlpD